MDTDNDLNMDISAKYSSPLKWRAKEPRPPMDPDGIGIQNEHVYKYWRWQAWVLKSTGRLLAAAFHYDWARQERVAQEPKPYRKKN